MSDLPHIDDDLVRRLVAAQFPQWAHLPLRRLDPAGSDNVIHRLGEDMAVRLPRGDWAAGQAAVEARWLPRLAARLPVPIPEQLGLGAPAYGYPWRWSVCRWLDGVAAGPAVLVDPRRTAAELGGFLRALWGIGPDADLPVQPPLSERDEGTRKGIAVAGGAFDAARLTALWDTVMDTPVWSAAPVWVHGDMHDGNVLTVDGRVSAVIDFGGTAQGDPAIDLMIAWTLFDPGARAVFREAVAVDDATWMRGRGWALAGGLSAYNAYAATNPRVAAQTRRQIEAALAEQG